MDKQTDRQMAFQLFIVDGADSSYDILDPGLSVPSSEGSTELSDTELGYQVANLIIILCFTYFH